MPTVSGKKLTLIMLGIVIVVVGGFVSLAWLNLDKIFTSVAVRRSEKPILSTPTGEMVIVPEGEFQVEPGQAATPLRAFYIDKMAVTGSAYVQFAREKGLPVKPVAEAGENDARAYCEWAGKRLPTPEERAKAARGARPGKDVSIYGVLGMAFGLGFRCAKDAN